MMSEPQFNFDVHLINENSLEVSVGTKSVVFAVKLNQYGNPIPDSWMAYDQRIGIWRTLEDVAQYEPAVEKVMASPDVLSTQLMEIFNQKRRERLNKQNAAKAAAEAAIVHDAEWLAAQVKAVTPMYQHASGIVFCNAGSPNTATVQNAAGYDPRTLPAGKRLCGILVLVSSTSSSGFEWMSAVLDTANPDIASRAIANILTKLGRKREMQRSAQRVADIKNQTVFDQLDAQFSGRHVNF